MWQVRKISAASWWWSVRAGVEAGKTRRDGEKDVVTSRKTSYKARGDERTAIETENEQEINVRNVEWFLYIQLSISWLNEGKLLQNAGLPSSVIAHAFLWQTLQLWFVDPSYYSSADWLKWCKVSQMRARRTGLRAESRRVKSASLIELPWLLCHLQLAGDKRLFMTQARLFFFFHEHTHTHKHT